LTWYYYKIKNLTAPNWKLNLIEKALEA